LRRGATGGGWLSEHDSSTQSIAHWEYNYVLLQQISKQFTAEKYTVMNR